MLKFRWETEFKETEIGEIPKDWEVKEVKHLVDKTIKFPIVDGPFGTQLHMDEYTSEGIPVIRVINLSYEGEFIEDDMVFISEEKFNQLKRSAVKHNDLIIAKTGATIGKLALLPKHISQALITSSCLKVTFDLNNAIPKYYLYFFITQIGQENIKNRAEGGSTRDTINLKPFSEIPVPLPPLPEQSRIANVLSWFDDLIENKRRQNEILEKTAMAIFKSWFIDFEPFKDGELVFNEKLGKEIPKGWGVNKTTKLIEFNPPISMKRGLVYPFIEMKNVNINSLICETNFKQFVGSGVKYYGGDTLMARITPSLEHGKTAFVWFISEKEKGFGSTEFFVLHPKESYLKEFVYLLAKNEDSREAAINSMTGTSGRQRADINALKDYIIPIPPSPILQSFHILVKPLFQKIILNQKQIMTLRKIRDTLLPLLVFGKLRVEEL